MALSVPARCRSPRGDPRERGAVLARSPCPGAAPCCPARFPLFPPGPASSGSRGTSWARGSVGVRIRAEDPQTGSAWGPSPPSPHLGAGNGDQTDGSRRGPGSVDRLPAWNESALQELSGGAPGGLEALLGAVVFGTFFEALREEPVCSGSDGFHCGNGSK